jgi:hypothetical protein
MVAGFDLTYGHTSYNQGPGQARLDGSYDHIGYGNQGTSPGNPTAETCSTTFFDFYHQRQYTGYATGSEQVGTTNDFDLSSALTGNNEFSVGVKYVIGN